MKEGSLPLVDEAEQKGNTGWPNQTPEQEASPENGPSADDKIYIDDEALPAVNMSLVHGFADVEQRRDKSLPVFPYKPISKNKPGIRIITLLPGSGSNPIECTVQNLSLEDACWRGFEALSYAWGPPQPNKTINLQGIPVQVRRNLWQALRHLRLPDTTLSLWIDAICINQNDVFERSHQVSMMGEIYHSASRVLVWLGPPKDSSKLAMDFIGQNLSGIVRIPLQKKIQAVIKLTQREYWRRTWIIQEILMARKVAIYCGRQCLDWEYLKQFFFDIRQHGDINTRTLGWSLPAKLALHTGRDGLTLEELLETYKDSLSSDPRDKVYSLIGLTERIFTEERLSNNVMPHTYAVEDWIAIDYSKSELDLFWTLILMFYTENPESALHVKRMKLFYDILDLQTLASNPPASNSQPIWMRDDAGGLSSEFVTCRGQSRRSVAVLSPLYPLESLLDAEMRPKVTEWIASTSLLESWRESFENSMDKLSCDDVRRVGADFNGSNTSGVHIFLDRNGSFGFAPNGTRVGDKIVHFRESLISFVVRDTGNNSVIGRALLPHLYIPEKETQHDITLHLGHWLALMW